MAHKQLENGRVVVDWTTGDPEGDRLVLLSAYRDMIKEIRSIASDWNEDATLSILEKWGIDTENQIDEVPRIWIKRPTE